jgi:hypothetical protein
MECGRCGNPGTISSRQCKNPQGGEWGSQAPCYCNCHEDNQKELESLRARYFK